MFKIKSKKTITKTQEKPPIIKSPVILEYMDELKKTVINELSALVELQINIPKKYELVIGDLVEILHEEKPKTAGELLLKLCAFTESNLSSMVSVCDYLLDLVDESTAKIELKNNSLLYGALLKIYADKITSLYLDKKINSCIRK